MKKVSFIVFLFVGLSFLGCSKQNMKQSKTEDKVNTTEKVSESKAPVKQVNPEIEKLTRVISAMSERCKAEMSDGSLEELLAAGEAEEDILQVAGLLARLHHLQRVSGEGA